jgi:hypothetical protein
MTQYSVELVQRIEEDAKKKVELCETAEDIATLVEAGQAGKAEMNDANGQRLETQARKRGRSRRRNSRNWDVDEDEKVQR